MGCESTQAVIERRKLLHSQLKVDHPVINRCKIENKDVAKELGETELKFWVKKTPGCGQNVTIT